MKTMLTQTHYKVSNKQTIYRFKLNVSENGWKMIKWIISLVLEFKLKIIVFSIEFYITFMIDH